MTVVTLTPADTADYCRLRLAGLIECPTAFCSSPEDELALSAEAAAARLVAVADGSACVFGVRRGGRLAGVVTFSRQRRAKLAH